MGDNFFMDFSFFAHKFFKENLWNFFSWMPDALGVCGTLYKVKKNLFWGESWLPLRNARTRVRLLHLLEATCYMLYSTNQSRPLEHMYPSWDNFNFFHNFRLQQITTIWYYFWLLETTWYYLRLLETTWDYLRLLKTT